MTGFDYLLARRLTNHVVGGTNFSVDTTHHKIIVPAGKRWLAMCGMVSRDVSATLSVSVNDSSDNKILQVAYSGAATTVWAIPSLTGDSYQLAHFPIIMEAGDYMYFTFGVAQTAAAIITLFVLEADV